MCPWPSGLSAPGEGCCCGSGRVSEEKHPDVPGFSPRNLRRMRDFYRMYKASPELRKLAMDIGWTQNVVILEADLSLEERRWYLLAVRKFGWSKAELQRQIDSAAHLELHLDERDISCYNTENSDLENTAQDQEAVSLSLAHLQRSNGHGGRQPDLSDYPPQAGRMRHRLLRQTSPAAPEQQLREVPHSGWHGLSQPAEHVPDLWRRFCRQDAPADGLYQPFRRGGRSVVHR